MGVVRHMLMAAIALGLVAAAPNGADAQKKKRKRLSKPKKQLSLDSVAQSQQDPMRQRLQASVRRLRQEEYDQAAVELHGFLEGSTELREEAQYNLGKSLYRLGHLHSALHYFSGLLAKGPSNRFYKSSLEWCLFISRKMVDDEAVNEVVAKYATSEFPADYRDEFFFRLARYHYTRGLAVEAGALAGKLGELRVKESETGGLSISGDLFGEDPFAEPDTDKPDPQVEKKRGGGLSIGEDLFGDPPPPPPKRRRRRSKARKKKGGGISLGDDLFGDPSPPPSQSNPSARLDPVNLTAKEHMDAASKFVVRVNDESKFGPRAKFLDALLSYYNKKPELALESLKAVVRMTRQNETLEEAEKLREAAFFQLARVHFGAQQPTFSIFYYSKVNRDSYQWLDALYEASWAEFRLGNYEKSLGNLLTVHAPFFDNNYYPESRILKAVVYYENCRYPEAKDILTRFLDRYNPVLEELDRLVARDMDADKYYETLENMRSGDVVEAASEQAKILVQVLDIALSDPELKRLDASIQEVNSELESLKGTGSIPGSSLMSDLEQVLVEVRGELRKQAGKAVKNQLERERKYIKDLIQQAIRIDIETSRSEQETMESELRGVKTQPKNIEKEYIEWADDEKLVWPFEGEYWRDELGTYELTLAQSCR